MTSSLFDARSTDLRWYRYSGPRAVQQSRAVAVHLPRVHAQGLLAVYVDGVLLGGASLVDGLVHFNRPILLGLAASAGDGDAELVLRNLQTLREWAHMEGRHVASA